jgi:uncharacterized SAM-binding protein YcdF (DUF218 family)
LEQASPEKGGVYSDAMYDKMDILAGFAAVTDITASRLGKRPQDVTFEDIEEFGPTLYYNGEGPETKNSNYSQNEDLRKAAREPDFPFPVSKLVIGEIDVANTPAQARGFGEYLRSIRGEEGEEFGKVAVVSLASHAPRVARYIQKEIEDGNMPADIDYYGVAVPIPGSATGAGVREVRKIVQYHKKGDLAATPAYSEYYRPRTAEEWAEHVDERIRELITAPFDGELPDAIIALSGGIRPSISSVSETGFKTLSYADKNETGVVVPSKTRVIATAAIANAIPDVPIVTNSVDRTQPEWPSMASVVADELVHRGVDRDRIILEEESFNTATQLIEMINLAVDNGWQRLSIVANDWYFPRLGEFYNQLRNVVSYEDPAENAAFHAALDRFEEMGGQVSLVGSEEVMILAEPRFRTFFAMAEHALEETLASERRGLEALRAGRYAVSFRLNR